MAILPGIKSMYKGRTVAVVVPSYNEEQFIIQTLGTIPSFVDKIYAVNDSSTDHTLDLIISAASIDKRIQVVNRRQQGGVGAAILSGHKLALQDKVDVIAVMAGDGQMDPEILGKILDSVVEGRADYAKGNRLSTREHRREMPVWRAFGNFLLTHLTRITSGYHSISDPQNGYTAVSAATLRVLNLDSIEEGFVFENEMLVMLNIIGARVVDIPHPARYRGQTSKIRYPSFILRTSWVLLRRFVWRIWMKYFRKRTVVHFTETENA